MKKGIILLIVISTCLSIYLVLSGIREIAMGKIVCGMICGAIALFWLMVEGESHGA